MTFEKAKLAETTIISQVPHYAKRSSRKFAPGIYLYVMIVKGQDGTVLRGKVRELALLG